MIETGTRKRKVRRTRLTYGLLAVAAVVLLLLDRPAARPDVFNELRAQSDDVAAPMMGVVSAPTRGLRSLRQALDRRWAVQEQNDELRQRVAELEGWRELALSLRDKVNAYEAILDIPGVETVDPIGAWTVGESGGPFQHARLMAIGQEKGVKAGYPVLNDRGLLGRVISVGQRSSRALLLSDSSSRVPVMTEDGKARGVLTGDNTEAPRLEYVNGDRTLREGDRIVTSGDGGLFPRGLPVGQAARAGGQAWRVALYSDGQPIDVVWIYPHEPVAPPPPEPDTPLTPAPPAPDPDSLAADGAAADAEIAAEQPGEAAPAAEELQ